MSSPGIEKYFAFPEVRRVAYDRHPVPTRGALAIVTNAGRGCDGRGGALDERHHARRSLLGEDGCCVRQRRVVLTPRCWRRRWQQCKAHRGDHVISRKAIAQGMPDVLRCPVCSCAHFLPNLRMRPRVQRASGIPCALWIERGRSFLQSSGAMRRENANCFPCHPEVRHVGEPEDVSASRRAVATRGAAAVLRNCAAERTQGDGSEIARVRQRWARCFSKNFH